MQITWLYQSESHVKQIFVVICSCLCGNAFFYSEILFFLNSSRILQTLCSVIFPACFNYFSLFWGGFDSYGWILSSVHLPSIYWTPIMFTLMPQGWKISGETAGCVCCSEEVRHLVMLHGLSHFWFSASDLLTVSRSFSKNPAEKAVCLGGSGLWLFHGEIPFIKMHLCCHCNMDLPIFQHSVFGFWLFFFKPDWTKEVN